jgi:glycerate kinase
MRLLFASDSFKGSLTSKEISELLTEAARETFTDAECVGIPVADGGEGTVDALIDAMGGEKVYLKVHDPLMVEIDAYYGKLSEKSAVIEMASASGIILLPEEERNPLYTTTYGTGEMILDALDKGFTDLYIAIGGSATNDGGMGCGRALGIRFFDRDGGELSGTGIDLEKVLYIDTSGLDPRIKDTNITVMCDVTNPLCGLNGATRTFAEQKGATAEMIERLEWGMCNYRDVIRSLYGIDPNRITGGGAAGGLGAMLITFLDGHMKSGIETVLDIVGFDEHLRGADYVITGEGRCDWQSSFGKVVCGVGERAKKSEVPVIVICGSVGQGAENLYDHGVKEIIPIMDSSVTLDEAMRRAKELYYEKALSVFKMI